MKSQTLIIIVMLLLCFPLHAQDSDYPTLDALAKVEIPIFNYADMVGRMSRIDTSYTPPASPPKYTLGDTETFTVIMGEDEQSEQVEMELRGQTQRVLIWVQTTVDYPRWRALALAQRIESQALNPVERLFQSTEPPGVDGDPRLYVIMISDPEGTSLWLFPVSQHAPATSCMRRATSARCWWLTSAFDDDYDFYDKILIAVIAHEFLHILHYHSDPGEEILAR